MLRPVTPCMGSRWSVLDGTDVQSRQSNDTAKQSCESPTGAGSHPRTSRGSGQTAASPHAATWPIDGSSRGRSAARRRVCQRYLHHYAAALHVSQTRQITRSTATRQWV